jgi:Antirestriction protein (ArdA)
VGACPPPREDCSPFSRRKKMDTPKIYVVCLAAFDKGLHHGQWISTNQTIADLYKEIHQMLANSPVQHAEKFGMLRKVLATFILVPMSALSQSFNLRPSLLNMENWVLHFLPTISLRKQSDY